MVKRQRKEKEEMVGKNLIKIKCRLMLVAGAVSCVGDVPGWRDGRRSSTLAQRLRRLHQHLGDEVLTNTKDAIRIFDIIIEE